MSQNKQEEVKEEDLIIGSAYKFKMGDDKVYLGKYQYRNREGNEEHQEYFFYSNLDYVWGLDITWSPWDKEQNYIYGNPYFHEDYVTVIKDLSNIVSCVDIPVKDKVDNIIFQLEKSSLISKRDCKKDQFIPFTFEEFFFKVKGISSKGIFGDLKGQDLNLYRVYSGANFDFDCLYGRNIDTYSFWVLWKLYRKSVCGESREKINLTSIPKITKMPKNKFTKEQAYTEMWKELSPLQDEFCKLVFDYVKPGYIQSYDYEGNKYCTYFESAKG